MTEKTANNTQVGGDHYMDINPQPWDVINTWIENGNISFTDGLAIRYIARHRGKNGIEDLKKAIHCLEKSIELL